jgi:hypothetical protein
MTDRPMDTATPAASGPLHRDIYSHSQLLPAEMIALRARTQLGPDDQVVHSGRLADGSDSYEIRGPQGIYRGELTIGRDSSGAVRYRLEEGVNAGNKRGHILVV